MAERSRWKLPGEFFPIGELRLQFRRQHFTHWRLRSPRSEDDACSGLPDPGNPPPEAVDLIGRHPVLGVEQDEAVRDFAGSVEGIRSSKSGAYERVRRGP